MNLIRTIQTHFVLFLIYSFAGWFLKSAVEIINVKNDKILLQMKLDKAREDRIAKMKERFEKKSKLHERLLKAFPNFNIGKK